MKWASPISPRSLDWGLLFLRIPVGITFIFHGSQKVFGGIPQFADQLAQMGVPGAPGLAFIVAYVEFLGGISILIGLFTPLVSVPLILILLVAIAQVHLSRGLNFATGGFEPHLAWIGILLCLILTGPGRYSVDRLISARKLS